MDGDYFENEQHDELARLGSTRNISSAELVAISLRNIKNTILKLSSQNLAVGKVFLTQDCKNDIVLL